MRIEAFECEYGPCPYLGGRRWRVEEFSRPSFDAAAYETLLAEGWRRSGFSFYRDSCPDCRLCVPIRLDSAGFAPSRSQRRVARLNADLDVRVVAAAFSDERYELYRSYIRARHAPDPLYSPIRSDAAERESYASFLLADPLGTWVHGDGLPYGACIVEYRDGSGALLATGYVDVLPDGLSSVYFAFDPAASRRSLGTYSVLRELELARQEGKRYYYLGFWVPGSPSMDYKASFRPFERASNGTWLPAEDRGSALAAIGCA